MATASGETSDIAPETPSGAPQAVPKDPETLPKQPETVPEEPETSPETSPEEPETADSSGEGNLVIDEHGTGLFIIGLSIWSKRDVFVMKLVNKFF